MAGEKKGKTYEAIVKIALDRLATKGAFKGAVFWNERPAGMTIEPDFTIGPDKDHPTHAFLVTHSSAAGNSHMKFWRNMGELAETKSALTVVPDVYGIAFDSEIKEDLISVQGAAFDGQLVVGQRSYGDTLTAWVDEHVDSLPVNAAEKADAIDGWAKTDATVRNLIDALVKDLAHVLAARQPALDQLWLQHRTRPRTVAPTARDTFYRRGFTKAMVLGLPPGQLVKPLAGDWGWAVPLGLARKGISNYRVVDEELLWLARSPLKDVDPAKWPGSFVSQGFRDQVQKVRSVSLLSEFQAYVLRHLADLKRAAGIKRHLLALHADPASGLSLPPGVPAPTNVWLFDYVGALLKAKAKRAQAFGYSAFSSHPQANSSTVGSMNVGTWCTCFMNQFFNRKAGFVPPSAAIDFVAEVLSETLTNFSVSTISGLAHEIQERYVAKELVAVLFTHRGFDPIGALLRSRPELAHATEERIQAGFAERCLDTGRSASTGVLRIGSTLINWQSATEEGRDHKKKELCGRAPALRYAWDRTRGTFVVRPGVK